MTEDEAESSSRFNSKEGMRPSLQVKSDRSESMARTIDQAMKKNPHLADHVRDWFEVKDSQPKYMEVLTRDLGRQESIDLIYPLGDPLFVHVYYTPDESHQYMSIEPSLSESDQAKFREALSMLYTRAMTEKPHKTLQEFEETIDKLLNEVIVIVETEGATGGFRQRRKVAVKKKQFEVIRYFARRNIIYSGRLEPLLHDPYIEDIHSIGLQDISIVHKIFGPMTTNIKFETVEELDSYVRSISERMGHPASLARPIIDGSLPDGSRLNLVYAGDVSVRGPSFSIRKFAAEPISIIQLIQWNTLSSLEAAYFWMCLENGMSMFFCGETASGKTSTLNSVFSFIKHDSKVYTAEDTLEVQVPQDVWQRLGTRDYGPQESQVDMFSLLKAALRSRPNYIIVGEIRGKEGSVAFQAMQTGHPVLATFHASTVKKLVQRFSSDPINVPVTFMDNLNVTVFQAGVWKEGRFLRRITSIDEILGYNEALGGVLTRTVFLWDTSRDEQIFKGMNNSYILEEKIGTKLGYADKRRVYDDLYQRARILERMLEEKITKYEEVDKVIGAFQREGVEGLPFSI